MTNKKKVLIVIPTLGAGGGEKFVIDLTHGLNKDRFQVKILVLYPSSGSIFDRFAEEKNLDVVYLDKKFGFDYSMFFKVKRIVKAFNPDVIHSNLDAILYLLFSYNRKQSKLHTIHNMADKEALGLKRLVRRAAFSFFGVMPVAISKKIKETIVQVYHISENRIPLVNNGMVCRRYQLPKSKSAKTRLITVASMHKVKNHAFLLECFAKLRQEFDDVHLTLVGDGILRQDIERKITELHIEDDVTITGVVSDVENYLADADIYVAASIYEGLPISILEAMASGLPIISTNVGGVSDVVQHGVNGLLVELGNQDDYIEAMRVLSRDRELRTQYALASKETAKEYDISHMIAGYEALYSGK